MTTTQTTLKGETMTLANQISRDTERLNPRIERHSDGDITFHWSRPLKIARVAALTGLDDELFHVTYRDVCLHLPASIAASDVK